MHGEREVWSYPISVFQKTMKALNSWIAGDCAYLTPHRGSEATAAEPCTKCAKGEDRKKRPMILRNVYPTWGSMHAGLPAQSLSKTLSLLPLDDAESQTSILPTRQTPER